MKFTKISVPQNETISRYHAIK